MERALDFLNGIAPDMMERIYERMKIIHLLSLHQPIGRRNLSKYANISERSLRSELENMRYMGLVHIEKRGVTLSDKAEQLLPVATLLLGNRERLIDLEEKIMEQFDISACHVVPGDLLLDRSLYAYFGEIVSHILQDALPEGDNILAITGGETLASVVPYIDKGLSEKRRFIIVPARGGGSGSLAIQSNTISHALATQLDGEHQSLYVPEQLSQSLQQALMNDPAVFETILSLQQSNCLIYSVGSAKIMAERRSVSFEDSQSLLNKGAVGEVMGVFFDKEGNIVYRLARIGLVFEDLKNLPCEVLVVGGSHKSVALAAYLKKLAPKNTILVLDEALANLVLKEVTL